MFFFFVQFRGFKYLLTSLFLILSFYSTLTDYQKYLCSGPLSSTNACISIQFTTPHSFGWLFFLRRVCDEAYPSIWGSYAQGMWRGISFHLWLLCAGYVTGHILSFEALMRRVCDGAYPFIWGSYAQGMWRGISFHLWLLCAGYVTGHILSFEVFLRRNYTCEMGLSDQWLINLKV